MLISDLFESETNYDLQGRYDEFNRLYFGNELPHITVEMKPLKTVGGMVKAAVKPIGPKTHPALIRLGHPKYKDGELRLDSMRLVISTAYARLPGEIDSILLHEMIHVWEMAIAKVYYENHAKTFLEKRKEVMAASGIDIPLTDSTKGLELANAVVSAVGVVLRPVSGGKHAFMLMSTQALQRQLGDIQALARDKVSVWTTDSKVWLEKSQRHPLQRSFTKLRTAIDKNGQFVKEKAYNLDLKWWVADADAVADLKANGKLLWSSERLSEGARGRLYNASTVDHDPQGWMDPHVSGWVKEIALGAGDWDEDNVHEITEPMLYLGRDPTRWVRTIVARKTGKHPNEVTDDDVRKYGRLNIIDDYDDDDVYHVHNDGKVSPLSGRDEPYYESLPVGPEPGDIISRNPLKVSRSITGDELVRALQRGLTENREERIKELRLELQDHEDDPENSQLSDAGYSKACRELEELERLTEAPITDVNHIGAWGDKDRNSSFRNPIDRRLVSHPAHVQNMKNAWSKTEDDFNIMFANSPEAGRFQEIGLVDYDWMETNMPETTMDRNFRIDHNKINVLFTNNSGAERVPMTPWVLAHRLSHAISRGVWFTDRRKSTMRMPGDDWLEAMTHLEEIANIILQDGYKAPTFQDRRSAGYQMYDNRRQKENIRRRFFQEIGKFKSAKESNLRNHYEFYHELFAQFIITGKVDFRPIPRRFNYERHRGFSFQGPDGDMEYYNDMLNDVGETLSQRFRDALARAVGEIFVM